MTDEHSYRDAREQQLDAIIAEYYRLEEKGAAPDQKEFMARYPELKQGLSEFFADLGMFQHSGWSGSEDPALEPTMTPNASRQSISAAGSPVRYFGAYEIIEELGSGGMGVVYKARHARLRKFVALKMIRAGELATELEVRMFEAEARAAAKLDHPGIVAVHEVGIHAGQHFYSMDYVVGGNLSKLHRDEPVPARRAAELVKQLAEAVHYAHGQGIVHRDLKPANVLLTTDGVPRITDFGLAKRMWAGEDSIAVTMTETGRIVGTPGYMSPEQAEGKTNLVAAPADIYALGAVLYALLTSRAPFVGESQAHIITQVIRNEPVSPRMLNPNVPRDLETICLKCLSKEPHSRYGTAQLLAEDLQRFLEGRPVLARPISRPARVWRWCGRNPVTASLLTAIAFSLLLGIGISSHFARESGINERRALELAAVQTDLRNVAENKTDVAEQSLYLADIRLAAAATDRREFGAARSILKSHIPDVDRPDRRGWEWFYLLSMSQRRSTTLYGHSGAVSCVAWNPSGSRLASADVDGTIRLWDVARRDFSFVIDTSSSARSLAWSPPGDRLAVGLHNEIRIYDAATGNIAQTISTATGNVHCIAWHRDRPWLAWGDESRSVTVHDLDQKEQLWRSSSGGSITRLAWRPASDHLAITNWDHTAKVWDIVKNAMVASFSTNNDGYFGASWNSEGTHLAAGTSYFNYSLAILDVTARKTRTLSGHVAGVTSTSWSPDDRRIATASLDRTVRIWNAETGEVDEILDGHSEGVNAVAWSPSGTLLASASDDGTVIVWDLGAEARMPVSLTGHRSIVRRLEWAPDSSRLASIGFDSIARVWNVDDLTLLTSVRGEVRGGNNAVCWDPQGKYLVTDDRENGVDCVHVWDIASQARVNTIVDMPINIAYVHWSPDGKLLAVSGEGAVAVLKPLTSELLHKFDGSSTRLCATDWSPDSKELAISALVSHGITSIFDIESGKRKRDFPSERATVETLQWGPDGRWIATGNRNGHIHIYDAQSGRILHIMKGHRGAVNGVRWNPDSTRLASASHDGTVRIWDAASGDEVLSLPGNVGILWSVAWSPNGERIAASSNDGHVLVWDAGPGYETASRSVIPWWITASPLKNEVSDVEPVLQKQSSVQENWHSYVANLDSHVDLTTLQTTEHMKWAISWLHSPQDQHALLRFGHSTPLELSVNNAVVYSGRGDGVGLADSFVVEVPLNAGWNQLGIHFLGESHVQPNYSLRIGDVSPESPVRSVRFSRRKQPLRPEFNLRADKIQFAIHDSVEREIAETVLSLGGVLNIDGKTINDSMNLPQSDFVITGIECSGKASLGRFFVARLRGLTGLRRLNLAGCSLSDEQMAQLATFSNLEELCLQNTNLGDAAIGTMDELRQLKKMDISDTVVSEQAMQRLRASLPHAEIIWNAREPDRAVAQRLLARNARISVMMGQQRVDLISSSDLPEIPFRVVAIKAEEKLGLTVKDFEGLDKLDALESIDVLHTGVDDEVLAKLHGLTSLQSIGFGGTPASGKPLAKFSLMPSVHTVVFGGGLINESLEHFDRFPNLTTTYIGWNPIDDAGLEILPSLPKLELLWCGPSKIRGSGFTALSRFPKLRDLSFTDTLVDDDGLKNLPVLPGLTDLRLGNTLVTDASVPHLSRFTTLTSLELLGTTITPAGIAELRKTLKGCTIEWSPPPVKVPEEH